LPNAYKVNGNSNNAVGIIFYLAIYGLPILIGVILLIFLIFIYKKFKKRKN
jgi:hypothetical protein